MDFLTEALVDTLKLLPLLAVVYFFVSFMEYRYGEKMGLFLSHFRRFSPVVGAAFGCIPQCGFSVAASALYVKRLISIGTLLAVFISTSDEAIPVLLSMPDKAGLVGLIIAIKVVLAIIAGVAIDMLLKKRQSPSQYQTSSVSVADEKKEPANIIEHCGCCRHHIDEKQSKFKALFVHPLAHTFKIFIFLFVLSALLGFILERTGEQKIAELLLKGTIFQPMLTTLIGLIPNCFASVLLAKFFADGTISFGSLIAGLCASAGLGLLVLVKENKNFKDTLLVVGLLTTISVLAGIITQFVMTH